jgi:hypothetical protein
MLSVVAPHILQKLGWQKMFNNAFTSTPIYLGCIHPGVNVIKLFCQ